MGQGGAVRKIAALATSLLLVGAFIGCRSGEIGPFVKPAPSPPLQLPGTSPASPPSSQPTTPLAAAPPSQSKPVFMQSSKFAVGVFGSDISPLTSPEPTPSSK